MCSLNSRPVEDEENQQKPHRTREFRLVGGWNQHAGHCQTAVLESDSVGQAKIVLAPINKSQFGKPKTPNVHKCGSVVPALLRKPI